MKKRTKIIIGSIVGIIFLVIIALIVYPIAIIAKFDTDLVRISHVQVEMGKENIDIAMDLAVRKQAPFHALLDSISYTVSLDTYLIVKGANNFDSVRKGDDFDSLLLPVSFKQKTLFTALDALGHKDSTVMITKFTAHYDWPIVGRLDVPIEITYRMKPPVIPEIQLEDIDIEKFSFDEPVVNVTVLLINKNDFALTLKDLDLHMQFEDMFNGDVLSPGLLRIEANDTSTITITAKIHELKPVKAIWQFLVVKNQVDFVLKAKTQYIDESGKLDPIDLNINTTGSVKVKSRKENVADKTENKKDQKKNNNNR
ncbi:hypothetical protein BH09BAC1_BH09BAC1_15330 [soil metagenome]